MHCFRCEYLFQVEVELQKTLADWQQKQDYLLQCYDLEKFQKEARGIEEALLDLNNHFSSSLVPTTLVEAYEMVSLRVPLINFYNLCCHVTPSGL
jgi:hypothetical protein